MMIQVISVFFLPRNEPFSHLSYGLTLLARNSSHSVLFYTSDLVCGQPTNHVVKEKMTIFQKINKLER